MNATAAPNKNSPGATTQKSKQSIWCESKKPEDHQKGPKQDFSDAELLLFTKNATELLPSCIHKTILHLARTIIHKVDKVTKHIKNLVKFKNPRRVPRSIRFKFHLTSSVALKGHSTISTLRDRCNDKVQETIAFLKKALQEKEYLEIENVQQTTAATFMDETLKILKIYIAAKLKMHDPRLNDKFA
eukprot:CAMPEP_0172519800 /NCGR_PEP_ID=MMETSP1066-20121228/291631_1 /TAXON_ID=671091 /ORGANISM="Coscinodiscus wailesii, Strain CCMP2513" /LENGTH=186 /DNA_ID=CAMNT_0013302453 /DNA_START=37 /DNA_END=597 /DNA_ORIENTATION=-